MKQFFKFLLATVIGFFLCIFLLFFIGGIIASSASQSPSVKAKPNSVLQVSLNTPLTERTQENPFADLLPIPAMGESSFGLNDVLSGIEKAKDDDNIKGIYLNLSGVPIGLAMLKAIRDQLIDFKESDKFIVAYGEAITQKAYYLASVADEIYLNPQGMIELKGYSSEMMFYKKAFEKLDIEPRVFYAGDYKSFGEPFRLDKMSDANREQMHEILDDLYDDYLTEVSTARNISKDALHNVIDNLLVQDAEDALEHQIVDELKFLDEVHSVLREKLGLDEEDEINSMDLTAYKDAPAKKKKGKIAKNKIAVIYAEGGIVDGKGEDTEIGSERYAKTIRKVRRDKDVKAIVLRVNSGGGSALASEVIWRELNVAKEDGIPVIASMGNVAASGGYYISCGADTILAEASTITGSIGVIGILMEAGDFFNNNLGLTFDTVKTARHSDFPTSMIVNRDLTEMEGQVIDRAIKRIYQDFLNRVAQGRSMTVEAVHEVAQGRVWTGTDAKRLGLIDVIGGLDDAIAIAAQKAGLDENDYRLREYPQMKDPYEKLMEEVLGSSTTIKQNMLKQELGEFYKYYAQLERLKNMRGAQAVMPFEIEIH